MCGIAGSINGSEREVAEMLECLEHRGPDDRGLVSLTNGKVVLGQQRLAIIDLSPGGHQPKTDKGGKVYLTYNGEIYNYKQLRAELEKCGAVFDSESDTEVIVQGYLMWGEKIFARLNGMWALALYDTDSECLYLSRDQAGMKPLYTLERDSKLFFASEIGTLSKYSDVTHNPTALKRFLAHGYIYGNSTLFSDIRVVPAGTTEKRLLANPLESSLVHFYGESETRNAYNNLGEAVKDFEKVFSESVRDTLQADVPIALFLSSGIDSSLVGKELQNLGAPLHSFTIGFEDARFDESIVAKKIAGAFGFPHTTILMKPEDIVTDIRDIFDSFGEPFADTSMLPTYYLSKRTHEAGYKVALTGDGADELFGGYPTHYLPAITAIYRHVPKIFDSLLTSASRLLPETHTKLGTKEKLSRFLLGARSPHPTAHSLWKRVFTDAELTLLVTDTDILRADATFSHAFPESNQSNPIEDAMRADFQTFLTFDCLVKSDICAMQHALELRMPFLNKPVIEFARSLPASFKATPFATKKLLRAALRKDLPPSITKLKKRGFVPPLATWLTTTLRPTVETMLSQEAVEKVGFLNYTYVASLIEEHMTRRRDHTKKLFALMSLSHFANKP